MPLFHLLQYFNVSILWKRNGYILGEKDINRLMIALIINEQNKIQNQLLRMHILKTCIPYSTFKLQEMLHISAVIFPTVEGKMYGFQFINLKRYRSV